MPERPPGRRGDHLHVPGRSQEQPERRRRSPLIGVDAGDVDDRPGAKPLELGRRIRLEAGGEDALADLQHQVRSDGVRSTLRKCACIRTSVAS